ncbi:MAG: sulfotransferase [Pseudoxanthomonas sp.]|jgi:tetratricopeptide (TPR) repeat protein|uniref:tetratricopeptide repeat-containing sulfotransferase family protein n=1 Tax=Pseudoxanthomonas TaxID=83618 RepID=UPI0025835728|nr:tetratricopeptide repeat-containing sulfotransferase family protein [Pseudoxanthomonas sp.]MCH2091923.1 sulfotransferase [Pseudoxanthomonas sp.]
MTAAAAPTGTLQTALDHARQLLSTDPAMAAQQAGEIIRVVGRHPMALLVLAASHRVRGQMPHALDVLEPLVREHPQWPLAHLEHGLTLGRAGRGGDAVPALRRALALKPDLPQAWRELGDHLSAMGDGDGAAQAYLEHTRHATRDPGLMQAAAALADNRIPEAEALLRAHLKRLPTDVAAIRMLAEVAARVGRGEDAESLLARCVELAPDFLPARQNYALVLHRANRPEDALRQIDRLLAHEPDNPAHLNLKAVVLCRIGDYEPALALYERVLASYPQQAKIWMSYGHALKTAGHTARAIDAYRRALSLQPGFGEVWWSLANLKTFRFSDDDMAVMRAQRARTDLPDEDRLHLDFALGKALEDAGDYAASFAHYRDGNALRSAQLGYRTDDTRARVQRLRGAHTAAFFAQRAGLGCDAPDPIFIVGMPRAGSTLLEQILSSHSAVEGTMELPDITSITRELREQARARGADTYHDLLATLDGDALRALGERYLETTRIHRKSGRPFFIDKMPNNFAHTGLIHLMLPNAKIIDARRHPLACCFSGFKQHFARGQGFSYGLEDIGRYYHDYVALMAHYDDVLPGRVHRVLYEQLVEDTEAEVRRLLAYCGLPFEDGCLRFFENARPVRTASSEQVRQPIYREGVDHWRHYEPWLEPLKVALGPVLGAYPAVPDFMAGSSIPD